MENGDLHNLEKHRFGIWIGKWYFFSEKVFEFWRQNFLQGVEFDETTADGRKCKTTVTKDGDTMITMQKAQVKGQKDVKVIRKFTDAGIEVQMICEDVVSDQFFARS